MNHSGCDCIIWVIFLNDQEGKREETSVVDSDFVIAHLVCVVVHVCSNVRTSGNHRAHSTVGIKKAWLGGGLSCSVSEGPSGARGT